MRPVTSPRRWLVLAVFALINLTIQTLWIAYAPITHQAAAFYGTSELGIGAFAMSYMVAFLPLSIPASWVIDTKGFKFGVGVGAVLMAVFGPLRGLVGSSYALAMACTCMLAAAQPFLLNAWTKCAALWFPPEERATAVGVVTLANLVGTGVGMALTPVLLESMTIPQVQLVYGLAAAVSSVLFLVFAKERPPGVTDEPRALMLDGLKSALKQRSFLIYLCVFFVGMGVFNGVTTWIEGIIRPRGFNEAQAGALGALMLGGGLFGAVIISVLSDRQRKRRFYLVLGMALGAPGLLGLAFATDFVWLAVTGVWMGFWLTSTVPVGMQYAAEITRPTPEGTSSGLIQLVGQASVVFVVLMEATKLPDGSFVASLMAAMVMLLLAAIASTRLEKRR
jgi:MFS family permease